MTYRTERSAFATGPRLESSPTSQPLGADDGTDVSQKKSCGYWTVTVRPSTQAGVFADETGWTVLLLAEARHEQARQGGADRRKARSSGE